MGDSLLGAYIGWSKSEKENLLLALQTTVSTDVDTIHEYIPSKSPEQIKLIIQYYKKIAEFKLTEQKQTIHRTLEEAKVTKKKPDRSRMWKRCASLSKWKKLLSSKLPLDKLVTETSTAIRMNAEFENKATPALTADIDFRKVYHCKADALEIETILSSKAFLKTSSYRHIMKSIGIKTDELHPNLDAGDRGIHTVVRYLASQQCYNPLNIPEKYLKPMVATQSDAQSDGTKKEP